ncbi:MAG: hypothetical protein Q9181_007814, partial [Wetmoreana brouardii]
MEHPNHNREFKSRNLWCVQHRGYCGSCKVACCVYEETIEAGKQAKDHCTKQLISEVGKAILAGGWTAKIMDSDKSPALALPKLIVDMIDGMRPNRIIDPSAVLQRKSIRNPSDTR